MNIKELKQTKEYKIANTVLIRFLDGKTVCDLEEEAGMMEADSLISKIRNRIDFDFGLCSDIFLELRHEILTLA